MRNSLIFKLIGAFLLVVLIGALVIYGLTSQATQKAFTLYTTRSGQVWAQRLAPVLADYYAQKGNWQGVESILQQGLSVAGTSGGIGSGQGKGRGMGQGRGFGAQYGGGMGAMADQRLILADTQGIVVSDTLGDMAGQQLTTSQLQNGAPILVDSQQVGTILVSPSILSGSNTPAGQFLASVNRSIITSAIIAGLIALLLGSILSLQITAPLRKLKRAASAIAGGDLTHRVTIRSRDEVGELGQSFNQMAESLDKLETQRQHLLADVAHELRTPLTVMQANLEAMLDGVMPLDAEQVAALHTETLLLNRLVGDLRLLSLAEAGELKLELHETRLGDLIQHVVERAKPQASHNGATLEVDLADDLPMVSIDADRITQVLNNLIGNALRYTPPEGKITVRATSLSDQKGLVQVSVTDTGSGIDPEALPYIFDRFYRAEKSRARNRGGSGLGLAIVKQLVEAHGGEVEAASPIFQSEKQQGYGTQISFTLPYQTPS